MFYLVNMIISLISVLNGEVCKILRMLEDQEIHIITAKMKKMENKLYS